MSQPVTPPVKLPNTLSELLAAAQDEVSPEDFQRFVFGTPSSGNPSDANMDELTEGLPPPHPDYIRQARLVLQKALAVNPDEHRVLDWFVNERLSQFEMATPTDVVSSGRTSALLAYLESVESGSSG